MGNLVSVTVHPAAEGPEYLSVSDAMRQVLDLIDALERTETSGGAERQIIWRLLEAHTNSPPFTVMAAAFSVDPVISVSLHAARVSAMFSEGVQGLLEGRAATWIGPEVATPLKRAFQRNLNGVGCTTIAVHDEDYFDITPPKAKIAAAVLDGILLAAEATQPDYTRTEYGAFEAEIIGIIRWNDKPALTVLDRLSDEKVTCVLSDDLAEEMGPEHKWREAWEDRRILVTGALHFGRDGNLKRVDAQIVEDMPWTDVAISELQGIDIVQGLTVREHLAAMRGESLG